MAKVSAAVEPSAAGVRDDQWRIPQALWERIEPLLPPRPPTRWVATIPGSMTVRLWTPSSSYSGPGANGTP